MKIFSLCLFLIISVPSFSQLDKIKILIGGFESTIINYIDSLNNLRPNPYSKINKDITDNGNLIFHNDFAMNDEDFYRCLRISFVMQRVAGIEICTREVIVGDIEYAEYHLNRIKDRFRKISENKWEEDFPDLHWGVTATFERKDGNSNNDYFVIIYDFKSI